MESKFGGVRRLAGALQADEHDDRRRRGGHRQRHALAAEQVDQRVVDERDDRLRRVEAALRLRTDERDGLLAQPGDERLDDAEIDVRFQQRHAHLAHRLRDILFGDARARAEALEDALQPFAE